jgi:exonuclease III
VTLLACYFPQLRAKAAFFDRCLELAAQHQVAPFLSDLWRLRNGVSREWTWRSSKGNGFRIDHAFGDGAFIAAVTAICTYDHRARETGLTDHSAVVVRISDVTVQPGSVGSKARRILP